MRDSARRFPPHWSVEETDACFIVRETTGRGSPTPISRMSPGRRAVAHLLTRDEGAPHRRHYCEAAGSCYSISQRRGVVSMSQSTNFTAELDQTDEVILYEVSDETLEAAAGTNIEGQAIVTVGPTIIIGGCC
jgi:hypothetical protein